MAWLSAQFADATLNFLREKVPGNWADLCDSGHRQFPCHQPQGFSGCDVNGVYFHIDLNQAPTDLSALEVLFDRIVPAGRHRRYNIYKILPYIFDVWMRILKQVEGSVLWLLEDNATASANLRKEAAARGINAGRLIFAKRMPLADHLARYRLADLFLDTLPYNAHTTASDALWAGLPVLTCRGETFAGRVATSLLTAIHLPELITTTLEDYARLAIELATNPDTLPRIKQKLAENRLTTSLFDTKLFTKHIEAAYTAMYERHKAGLVPDQIIIPN